MGCLIGGLAFLGGTVVSFVIALFIPGAQLVLVPVVGGLAAWWAVRAYRRGMGER